MLAIDKCRRLMFKAEWVNVRDELITECREKWKDSYLE